MIRLFVGNNDYTSSMSRNSIRMSQNLNNRTDTLEFEMTNQAVDYGSSVYLYEVAELTKSINAAATRIYVNDTYEHEQKRRVGDALILDIKNGDQEIVTITNIDHDNKYLDTTATVNAHTRGTAIGTLKYAGTVEKRPDKRIGRAANFIYKVRVTDRSRLYNRKNVVDTYESQYIREIVSRMTYSFVANDSETTIATCNNDPVQSGIIARYKFKEGTGTDTADEKGDHNGTITAATRSDWLITGGLTFASDGTKYVTVTDDDAFSINNTGELGGMVRVKGTKPSSGSIHIMGKSGWSNHERVIRLNSSGSIYAIVRSLDATYEKYALATGQRSDDTRIDIEFWVKEDGLTLYVNGVLQDTNTDIDIASLGNGVANFIIGSRASDISTKGFDGEIDEVIIMDRVPTAAECLAFHNAPFVPGGVATQSQEISTNPVGTFWLSMWSTWSGTATRTKEMSSMDLSSYEYVRSRIKTKTDAGDDISDIKIRLGTDASNYYERDIDAAWTSNENCRRLYSIKLDEPASTTGSPDLAAVVRLQFQFTAAGDIDDDAFSIDHIQAYAGGFQLNNVERGSKQREDVRVNHQKATSVLDSFAKKLNMFWYIDYNRNVYFFRQNRSTAPRAITDTSQTHNNLEFDFDITMLRNRQVVKGWEAASDTLHSQVFIGDGERESRPLDYKPKNMTIYEDRGSGYVEVTSGVENLTEEGTVDYLFNFNEKVVRRDQAALLTGTDKVKFEYNPYKAIRVQVSDATSIAAMKALTGGDGVYDWPIINDNSVVTYDEARQIAKAEVAAYKNVIITAGFTTDTDGLEVGQLISVQDSDRGIDDQYLIQQIQISQRDQGRFLYKVTATSSLFGLIEFYQLLLRRTEKLVIDENEIIDVVENVDETISWSDAQSNSTASKTYTAGEKHKRALSFVLPAAQVTADGRLSKADSVDPSSDNTNIYAQFEGGQTGDVQIDTSNGYQDGHALSMTADTTGASKQIIARLCNRLPVNASTSYTIKAWISIAADLGDGSATNNLSIDAKEYSQAKGGSSLATNAVVTGEWQQQDYNDTQYSVTFTTNASTTHLDLVMDLYQASGTVKIWLITIEESGDDSESNPGIAGFCEAT